MRYRWNPEKLKRKQHLCDEEGFTYCKAENGSNKLTRISDEPDPGRDICGICEFLVKKKAKPKGRRRQQHAKERDPFLRSWEWKQVRYDVLRDHGGCCSLCGRNQSDGIVLNVDHIKPRRKYPELALTKSNLQVLCHDCNMGKGNRDQTDWREPRLTVLMGERSE